MTPNGKPGCHADEIANARAHFANFAALPQDAKTKPYYPSIRRDLAGAEAAMITDAFDEEMKVISDKRRAHRS